MQLLLVPPSEAVVKKVQICHATSSYKNPYIVNEPAADGDVSGHADHTGEVFYPAIPKHTAWGDIIPPFSYDGGYFEGLNWDAEGQAIYKNDCNIPEAPPEPPFMVIEPTTCAVYTAPSLTVWLYDLQGDVSYRVIVSDQDGVIDTAVVPEGESGDGSFFWEGLPGGMYTVTLQQAIIAGEWETVDEQEFTVEDCPILGVTAQATACTTGANGEAVVNLTGLVAGEDYSWMLTGPDGTTTDGVLEDVDSDAFPVTFPNLPPGDYAFDIAWHSDDETSVSAQAAFTVAACPVVPPTPPKPAALAATGAEGTGGLLAAALVMMALGGGALAFRGRRPLGVRQNDGA
ncbi:hypothetical protein [uncultured Microbacterium sp.]|uniref:hypothetical protein n=1 Tax=uncultured Microbacterium sp. TaxID=191216 RepID=UPI0028D2A6D8|nr:hypothetical protein [uncultured Microbacterium sp.]